MNKLLLTLLLALSLCLQSFSQCASQTILPDSAFAGKTLLTSGSCSTYHLNKPLVTGVGYTFHVVLNGYAGGSCGSNPPSASVVCQVYLGYDSCDMTGQLLTITNGGFPFPDTLNRYNLSVHPSQSFTYISVVYSFNAGQGWVGCPSALIVYSFKLISSAEPLAVSVQLNNNSCAVDSNGKATAHATGYPPFTYHWNNGQTDSVLIHAPVGTYQVTVRDSTGCLVNDTIAIGTQTPPSATISLLPNDTLKTSLSSSYQWYLNGSAITGATSQYYVAQQNGNYDVVIIDSTGCTSSASSPIYIGNLTGIDEINGTGVRLYPNPATNSVTIFSDNSSTILKLCDLTGRELISKEISGKMNNFDISLFANGVYIIKILQGEKQFCQKLIINK